MKKRLLCFSFVFVFLLSSCAAPSSPGFTQADLDAAYAAGYQQGFEDAESSFFSSEDTDVSEVKVYITKSGEKYHRAGCQYLSSSSIPVDLEYAKQYYTPCSKCKPPF